jgi:FeS assembly SUF system protein
MLRETETLQTFVDSQVETRPTADATHASMSDAPDAATLTDTIVAALRTVHDPEIPVNVYDLGLIYRIELKDRNAVEIDMTLTAPGCPVAGEMLSWVQKAVSDIEGIRQVKVNLVFDPPWDKDKMSDEAKLELGLV